MPIGVTHFSEPMSAADRAAAKDERASWDAMEKRCAELEAALRNYPREPVGLLADNDGFRDRVLAWHARFAEWQFDLPILSKPKA